MIEPGDQERSELPECSAQYLEALEAEVVELQGQVQYAAHEVNRLRAELKSMHRLVPENEADPIYPDALGPVRKGLPITGLLFAMKLRLASEGANRANPPINGHDHRGQKNAKQ
jgi:hypothetical protein